MRGVERKREGERAILYIVYIWYVTRNSLTPPLDSYSIKDNGIALIPCGARVVSRPLAVKAVISGP